MADGKWTAETVIRRLEEVGYVMTQQRSDPARVSRANEAVGWLRFIDRWEQKTVVTRRIMLKPNGQPVYGWTKIAGMMEVGPAAAKRMFDDGIASILAALWASAEEAGDR